MGLQKVRKVSAEYKPYEPSKFYMDFYVAGFTYWDGLEVIEELSIGDKVELVCEPDNPYDPQAIAIYYGEYKIGYVPRDKNSLLSMLLYYGHSDVFSAKIRSKNLEEHSERQVRVLVSVNDAR